MRGYRKYEDVLADLRALAAVCARDGSGVLAGERALAEELGASRMTLRKALAEAEAEGLIRRTGGRTEVVGQANLLAGCGRVLFVAGGYRETFFLPAIERLWVRFSAELLARGNRPELFLVAPETPMKEWERRFAGAQVVFQGTPAPARLSAEGQIRFTFHDGIPAPNGIYLDNFRVGYLAADALLRAGCRRLVAIGPDYRANRNLTFKKRLMGFAARLREAGLRRPDMIRLLSYPHPGRFRSEIGDCYIRESRELLEGAYGEGCDGAFLICDVDIGSIAMNLFRQGDIPDRLKLITVNGSGDSMRHRPAVACVNHATAEVVAEAVAQLRRLAAGEFVSPVTVPVAPQVYGNETLGNRTVP
ncbi:MAG: GntR family transcriptional regulator [Lentisphaeria bacterium]|jgi:hypothetical protein|nr:GntR family transcriptional regulator [Lentisphaeria bacterium]